MTKEDVKDLHEIDQVFFTSHIAREWTKSHTYLLDIYSTRVSGKAEIFLERDINDGEWTWRYLVGPSEGREKYARYDTAAEAYEAALEAVVRDRIR